MDNATNSTLMWERNEDFAWESLKESVVIIDLTRQKVYELNQGAAWLWEALDRPMDRKALAVAVCLKHGLDYDEVVQVVDKFLKDSFAIGILQKKINPIYRFFKKVRKLIRIFRSS